MLCISGARTLVSLWYQGFGEVGFLRVCTRHGIRGIFFTVVIQVYITHLFLLSIHSLVLFLDFPFRKSHISSRFSYVVFPCIWASLTFSSHGLITLLKYPTESECSIAAEFIRDIYSDCNGRLADIYSDCNGRLADIYSDCNGRLVDIYSDWNMRLAGGTDADWNGRLAGCTDADWNGRLAGCTYAEWNGRLTGGTYADWNGRLAGCTYAEWNGRLTGGTDADWNGRLAGCTYAEWNGRLAGGTDADANLLELSHTYPALVIPCVVSWKPQSIVY